MTDRPFTRSPSEFERISQEMDYHTKCARVRELRATLSNLKASKSIREAALREVRPLERELGINESYETGYNRQRG